MCVSVLVCVCACLHADVDVCVLKASFTSGFKNCILCTDDLFCEMDMFSVAKWGLRQEKSAG